MVVLLMTEHDRQARRRSAGPAQSGRSSVAGRPPSLLEALKQIFRLDPVIEIPSQTPEEAMRETWMRVGDDLRSAMGAVEPEYERARAARRTEQLEPPQ